MFSDGEALVRASMLSEASQGLTLRPEDQRIVDLAAGRPFGEWPEAARERLLLAVNTVGALPADGKPRRALSAEELAACWPRVPPQERGTLCLRYGGDGSPPRSFEQLRAVYHVGERHVRKLAYMGIDHIRQSAEIYIPLPSSGRKPPEGVPLDVLGLKPRFYNALINAQLYTLESVCATDRAELSAVFQLGRRGVDEVVAALAFQGKYLRGVTPETPTILSPERSHFIGTLVARERVRPGVFRNTIFEYQCGICDRYWTTEEAAARCEARGIEAKLRVGDILLMPVGQAEVSDPEWAVREPFGPHVTRRVSVYYGFFIVTGVTQLNKQSHKPRYVLFCSGTVKQSRWASENFDGYPSDHSQVVSAGVEVPPKVQRVAEAVKKAVDANGPSPYIITKVRQEEHHAAGSGEFSANSSGEFSIFVDIIDRGVFGGDSFEERPLDRQAEQDQPSPL